MTTRQLSEDVVVTGIGGSAMIGQLDQDVVSAEEINQVMKLGLGLRHSPGQPLSHCSFATPGEDSPVPVGHLGQMIKIMDRMTFLPSLGQIGVGEGACQAAIPLRTVGQHEQVAAHRISHPVLRLRHSNGQLRPDDGGKATGFSRFSHPDDSVEAVMIGQGQP